MLLFVSSHSILLLFLRCTMSIRDILSWVNFINTCCGSSSASETTLLDPAVAYIHGACLVFLDGLGSGMCLWVCRGGCMCEITFSWRHISVHRCKFSANSLILEFFTEISWFQEICLVQKKREREKKKERICFQRSIKAFLEIWTQMTFVLVHKTVNNGCTNAHPPLVSRFSRSETALKHLSSWSSISCYSGSTVAGNLALFVCVCGGGGRGLNCYSLSVSDNICRSSCGLHPLCLCDVPE